MVIGVAELFGEVAALKHLEERRAAIGAGNHGGGRNRCSIRTPHAGGPAILDVHRSHSSVVTQNAAEAGVPASHGIRKGPRTASHVAGVLA